MEESRYNVQCFPAGHAFSPPVGSDLERRAKEHVEKGFLDALIVGSAECPQCQSDSLTNDPEEVDCLVRMSYQGTEFAVLHTDESKDDVFILSGELVSAQERDGEIIEFQIPREETEVRLARVSPFGWMLVNETTGRAWTSGVAYPNNEATIELPLKR